MCPPAASPNRLPAKRADQFQIYSPAALITNLASETARKNTVSPTPFPASWGSESGKLSVLSASRSIKARYRAMLLYNESCNVRVQEGKTRLYLIAIFINRENNSRLSSRLNVYSASTVVANIDVRNFERTSQLDVRRVASSGSEVEVSRCETRIIVYICICVRTRETALLTHVRIRRTQRGIKSFLDRFLPAFANQKLSPRRSQLA